MVVVFELLENRVDMDNTHTLLKMFKKMDKNILKW